ncbi:DUF4159 domain-containing protein [Candidatus Sumerlaeota bacterium]|nr:DUF4159 domain-containing protein [Candidatus Sumerlaeota bacterium]
MTKTGDHFPESSRGDLSRRAFLRRGVGGLVGLGALTSLPLLPAAVRAARSKDASSSFPDMDAFDYDEFVFSRFQYTLGETGDNPWDYGPDCDEKFLAYLRKATGIRVSEKSFDERVVRVTEKEKMFKSPFLFMTGNANFRLAPIEREAFAEFFRRGGFLYGDDCVVGTTDNRFFLAFVREVSAIFPGCEMKPVEADNAIYHCFYDFPDGHSPVYQGAGYPDMGLFIEDRMVSFLTCTDQHCAWRGSARSVRMVGKWIQEAAFKMGVNIVIYALTH